MSFTPAPDPPDAKLAALIAEHDREGYGREGRDGPRVNSMDSAPSSCARCQAIRMVAERAKTFRDAVQHRKAVETLRVHQLREHAPNEGDAV